MSPRRPSGGSTNYRPPFTGGSSGGTGEVSDGDSGDGTSRAQMLATTGHPSGTVKTSSGVTESVAQAYSHING